MVFKVVRALVSMLLLTGLVVMIPGEGLPESIRYSVQQTGLLVPQVARADDSDKNYDMVIVGAGTGGVAAAVQAARMGISVALLEDTDWIGGQMTAAGVGMMDEGSTNIRLSGFYKEFLDKINAHYASKGKSVSTCYWGSNKQCFEPSIAQKVLVDMITETKNRIDLNTGLPLVLDVYLRTKVASVIKTDTTIAGLVTTEGVIYNAKIVVDATETGDIIPMTGARYRVANCENTAINPDACLQDITYAPIIKKYTNGVPAELFMNTPPPGYDEALPELQQVVAIGGSTGWTTATRTYPVDWFNYIAFRGVPNSGAAGSYTASSWTNASKITKTGLNRGNDFPARWFADGVKLKVAYLEDPIYRKQADCEAKIMSLQLLYYIQHELGQPQWSVANDEGYDTPYNIEENLCESIPAEFKEIEKHFPVKPYVRESRRIVGIDILTGKEIFRSGSPVKPKSQFTDSMAVGYYFTDLHNCNGSEDLEASFESIQDKSSYGPFQVPYTSFIPELVDGFLVAEKNISQTRLVNGATRLQPITMLTGQAVGVIAALSVQKEVQPRTLRVLDIQNALLSAKSALSIYTFTDVLTADSYWKHTQLITTYGFMSGSSATYFDKNTYVRRDDVAVALVKLFKLPLYKPATATFSDVPKNNTTWAYVETAVKEGLMKVCSTGKFCPSSAITKAQEAEMLMIGMKLDPLTAPLIPYYSDVPATHPQFASIQLMKQEGVLGGCTAVAGGFCPNDKIKRAWFASALSKILLLP